MSNSQQQRPTPTKRQRREHPSRLEDNKSLACVASPYGPIHTPVASALVKEILLNRLQKEIVQGFGISLSVPRENLKVLTSDGQLAATTTKAAASQEAKKSRPRKRRTLAQDILWSRMTIGTNQSTRALERDDINNAPSLIVLARDVFPPTILAHIPLLAKTNDNTPILLLPGATASVELGAVFGIKKVGILVFFQRQQRREQQSTERQMQEKQSPDKSDKHDNEQDKWHAKIDSFVDFILSKQSS